MQTIVYPKETKARKEHTCNFCSHKIRKGESYMKSTHVHDGGVYDWKAHKNCAYITNRLRMYGDCGEGVTQDDFMDEISIRHDDLMIGLLPQDELHKYGDVIFQLKKVDFLYKLRYVVDYFKKVDAQQKNN